MTGGPRRSKAPVWVSGLSARDREDARHAKAAAVRPWRVEYYFGGYGGGLAFTRFYWTMFGARCAVFYNIHLAWWGGTAALFRNTGDAAE